jgi:hypothetical protein
MVAYAQDRAVRFPLPKLRSKYGVALVAALVLVLFLWRPGVYKLRSRIASSIGSALGRRVVIDNVSLHFLPRPGFDLEGLVVYDDPAFSAEPMIRAQEVSAAIRFRSLLRGRLEIATLSATEPSVNLVRTDEGRWNLASLVERNAQIPAAPTEKPAFERRPAFPYLEASGARINFKLGQTKKSYALIDADVALWQDSENSWAARIRAEPVRTDFNLTDTGLLQINARWQRASSLRSTPVQIAVQWQKGQLGQITQLLSGKDRGWRGEVSFTANISGTPEALRIESAAAIGGFRRYDIVGSESVSLATACSGQYDAVTGLLEDLLCESPVGGGRLRLRGNANPLAQPLAYDLTFEAVSVPLASVVQLVQHAKQQLPRDLTVSGSLNAVFNARYSGPPFPRDIPWYRAEEWTGKGTATNVRLSSNGGADEVSLGTVPLVLLSESTSPSRVISTRTLTTFLRTGQLAEQRDSKPSEIHLQIGPGAATINAAAPVNAGGWISAAGYRFFLRGDMELKDLFRLENVLALPMTRPAAEGSAKLDVTVSGIWQGFAAPVALGTAQLRNVRAEMRGLNTPIEIASATLSLAPDEASMQKISARTGSVHWSGEVTAPRHCAAPNTASGVAPNTAPNCVFQFDLTADELSTGDLAEWFTPHPAKRPWYRILNPNTPQGGSPLLAIQAHGNLHVGRLGLKKAFATQVATQVEVDRGQITLKALRAQLLQGTHQGTWTFDLSNRDVSNHNASNHGESNQPVRYHGSGTLRDVSLEQVSALMNDAWIAGTADGKFEVGGSGDSFREMLARSDGKLQFAMRNGSLPHIEIPGASVPLPVHRFTGELHLKKGAWELSAGRLESHDGIYRVSGTVSPSGGFDFVLTRGDEQSWALTGTLAKPRVASRAETDAKGVEP